MFLGVITSSRLPIPLGVRRHVSGEVMSLPERLPADVAAQLLLPGAALAVLLPPVVGAHVVHQVRRHAEADAAEGADVLAGEDGAERSGWQWWKERFVKKLQSGL